MGMNMTVNRLPARTWSWLKMNESSLKDIELKAIEHKTLEHKTLEHKTLDHIAIEHEALIHKKTNHNTLEIRGETASEAQWQQALFDEIQTGMGPDMEQAMQHAKAATVRLRARKEEREKTVMLSFCCTDKESSACPVDILAEEGSSITVLMDYRSPKNAQGMLAVRTRLRAEKNARIRLIQLQVLGEGYTLLNDVGAVALEKASVETLQLFLGSGKTYAGLEALLTDKESALDTEIGYLGRNRQRFDMNYVVRHQGAHSKSRINALGVLHDAAFKLLRGTIDFKTGACGAQGEENEDVLLLSDAAVNQTIPLILCGEEDVKGSHGATIGRLDEEMLFYLSSRGISGEEASSLIARARMDSLCARIGNTEEEKLIHGYLEEVMGNEANPGREIR